MRVFAERTNDIAVAAGGARRLGVIRPAELGDMNAKRAKVKVRELKYGKVPQINRGRDPQR